MGTSVSSGRSLSPNNNNQPNSEPITSSDDRDLRRQPLETTSSLVAREMQQLILDSQAISKLPPIEPDTTNQAVDVLDRNLTETEPQARRENEHKALLEWVDEIVDQYDWNTESESPYSTWGLSSRAEFEDAVAEHVENNIFDIVEDFDKESDRAFSQRYNLVSEPEGPTLETYHQVCNPSGFLQQTKAIDDYKAGLRNRKLVAELIEGIMNAEKTDGDFDAVENESEEDGDDQKVVTPHSFEARDFAREVKRLGDKHASVVARKDIWEFILSMRDAGIAFV